MPELYLSYSIYLDKWKLVEREPDPAGRADYTTIMVLTDDEAWFIYCSGLAYDLNIPHPNKGYAKFWHKVIEKKNKVIFNFKHGQITFDKSELSKCFLSHLKNKTEFESLTNEEYALKTLGE